MHRQKPVVYTLFARQYFSCSIQRCLPTEGRVNNGTTINYNYTTIFFCQLREFEKTMCIYYIPSR
jgi:hypothetical protein